MKNLPFIVVYLYPPNHLQWNIWAAEEQWSFINYFHLLSFLHWVWFHLYYLLILDLSIPCHIFTIQFHLDYFHFVLSRQYVECATPYPLFGGPLQYPPYGWVYFLSDYIPLINNNSTPVWFNIGSFHVCVFPPSYYHDNRMLSDTRVSTKEHVWKRSSLCYRLHLF